MSLSIKHLKLCRSVISPKSKKRWLGSLALLLCTWSYWIQPAQAEGSRTLYPSSSPAGSARANLEWRTDQYGGIVTRRTLLKVYANQGEYILLGSSAVGQGSADILVFNPGQVSGSIGSEIIPATPNFKCSSQPGQGYISSRTQELAGPQSISGSGNTSGYIPCYYKAPSTGIYDVVFYGTDGSNSNVNGGVTADINLVSSKNFDTSQGSSVAAWDVTVRSSNQDSITDFNGRLFTYYFALFTGNNGLPVYFSTYPVTTDGYQYKVTLRGTDPNGFVIYGNQVGFFDSDGKSILYHDVIGQDAQLSSPDGGTSLSRPQYPTFFNPLDSNVLPYLNRYRADGTLDGVGISSTPIFPTVNSVNFTGTAGGNNSKYSTGGTFTFNSNISGNYVIIISRDGTNFDPTNSQNRVLIGALLTSGAQSVSWNGKDNSGNYFPSGNNYKVSMKIHAGEYHFPMLDAENNYFGGPTITLLNATNPLGNTTGFYDDRGYTTVGGTNVGTPGSALCGINPPTIPYSDPINGFDTTTNQRAFGQQGNNGNANTKCNGSFGDTKGLDLWTYFPSSASNTVLNIVPPSTPKLLLVKRITAINGVSFNQFVDDPNSVEDNDSNWPSPTSTYLRGVINGGIVKPGDELEYTIYFLSKGTNDATNVVICDPIPNNTTFIPNTFNNLTPTDGGLPTAAQGIGLALDSTKLPTNPSFYLSNVADSDRGQLFAPRKTLPTACGSNNNTNGAVVVNPIKSPNILPRATAPGTPTNSYGFIRFRVKVN
ncbi:DUF11 domain-containing protein [Aetokthonos hydrillicola Thurmond2011]|jgi:uncharacterized repeat protein (TIGR01451 family)|uniref:DUF11 domain-containing protein n=1 Tax=Aetokthonos hydrillicola Thurmond2011 TaxID=2712845 RepID=A0AAP5I8C4_9CYAN|nr:DUF11 domain-containing protein [Aetokthonos hydrillicola]MBO3457854.1 DUF11 domain-containing protein [Aetokthonos hydrillicola CCALA 1050]MBW4587340.1 DUF11 domain-containing protein [Aetokthonos hydrillicola CCALA 1050]MDR9896635.1 DUF11 domain-containing protein [Aetokthonos hydrillicola Thurmond2011]